MSKRHDDAIFIQAGASNGSGIARALVKAYDEARAEGRAAYERGETALGGTDSVNTDPAVQLILHQLCHLARISTDDWARGDDNKIIGFDYGVAYAACVARASDEVLHACRVKLSDYVKETVSGDVASETGPA